MKLNYYANQIQGKRKKNLKEMVRLSPKGIAFFSLTLSDFFRGIKKNL